MHDNGCKHLGVSGCDDGSNERCFALPARGLVVFKPIPETLHIGTVADTAASALRAAM
jgi:hypothetical protein